MKQPTIVKMNINGKIIEVKYPSVASAKKALEGFGAKNLKIKND